jgi:hypothetical protein
LPFVGIGNRMVNFRLLPGFAQMVCWLHAGTLTGGQRKSWPIPYGNYGRSNVNRSRNIGGQSLVEDLQKPGLIRTKETLLRLGSAIDTRGFYEAISRPISVLSFDDRLFLTQSSQAK